MKPIFVIAAIITGLAFTSCSNCVECNGEKYCKENQATYTDSSGNVISWDKYADMLAENCP